MSRTALMLGLIGIAAVASRATGAANQAKNLAELSTLCDLISLADTEITDLPTADIDLSDLKVIRALNMSTADDNWADQFPSTASAKKADEPQRCKPDSSPKCREQWLAWQADKIASKDDANRPGNLKISAIQKSSIVGTIAQMTIAGLTAEAVHIVANYNKNFKPQLTSAAQDVKKELLTAAYGMEKPAADAASKCIQPDGGNRETQCAMPSAEKALCITLLCVCSKYAGTMTDDICGTAATPQLAGDTAAQMQAGWATLEPVCKKHNKGKVTADYIIAKIAQLKAMYKTVTHASGDMVILGTTTSAENCAKTANSACADYSKANPVKSGDKHTDIKWETHLNTVVSKLRATEMAKVKQEDTKAKLKTLRHHVESIFTTTALSKPTPMMPMAPLANGSPPCKQHTANTTCTADNNCKWEGESDTKGDCKPKEGEGKKTQETDGAAATNAEAKKCSDKKTEGECKDGCKWDGKECKDFSFLLNKQFALSMVSAAFVALLF
uniref:Variant surface glycoprotein (VSG), putative n=1 Tax=Trypanosoma brucei brucei (strain 927/4 GUTat10.1) TaxID=185431 RepID=Q4FKU6_TRYB2|nr:Variant surface glycoprotein (VSG), putative [Trypanosoma brucei brucei TREU927]